MDKELRQELRERKSDNQLNNLRSAVIAKEIFYESSGNFEDEKVYKYALQKACFPVAEIEKLIKRARKQMEDKK